MHVGPIFVPCIQSCDDILSKMETTLGQFQLDLGSISGEIQNLQDRVSYLQGCHRSCMCVRACVAAWHE